jgi:pyridoxal 5'-phosphate synthase pdxT subunit
VSVVRIGVLAVQGAFREHLAVLRGLGAEAAEVRLPEHLDGVDGLVLPGGESTAIGRLIRASGLEDAIRAFDGPVLGTCAGMILLARQALDGTPDQPLLGRIDLVVRRNGYGPQLWSFEADVDLVREGRPFRGVFIRAPQVAGSGPGVEVLGAVDGEPVLLRQGMILVSAFHPELTGDARIHQRFVEMVSAHRSSVDRRQGADCSSQSHVENPARLLGWRKGRNREDPGGGQRKTMT